MGNGESRVNRIREALIFYALAFNEPVGSRRLCLDQSSIDRSVTLRETASQRAKARRVASAGEVSSSTVLCPGWLAGCTCVGSWIGVAI